MIGEVRLAVLAGGGALGGDHDVLDDSAPVDFRRHHYHPDNSARDGGPGYSASLRQAQSAAHQQ